MTFTPKSWGNFNTGGTPLTGASLIDLETRVAAYADSVGGGSSTYVNATDHGISAVSASDQTSALATMYAGLASGTTVFFPAGTYIGMHAPGKTIRILGAGKAATVFRSSPSPGTNAIIVNFDVSTGCALESLTIDAQGNANVARGASSQGVLGQTGTVFRNLVVKNCTQGAGSAAGGHLDPHGYGAAGIFNVYNGVVEDCEVIDCVYPIFMHYADQSSRVVGNKVWCSASRTNCNQGISFIRWFGEAVADIFAGSLCEGNSVANVGYDPQGDGQNGNGIQVEHCIGVRIIGNTVKDCEGAGIHPADRAYGTKVIGNDVSFCGIDTAGGITPETSIDQSLGQPSGIVITGNHVHHNSKYGIMPSWSAATVVAANDVHDNGWEGIWCDSDRCTISDNNVYDNVRLNAAPVPNSSPNVKAQIKVTTGLECTVRGNQVFHTTTATPYADYAIATNDTGHIVSDNMMDKGWVTAALYTASPSVNIQSDNVAGGTAGPSTVPGIDLFNGYATTPDSANLSILSDIDLIAQITPDFWSSGTDQRVIAKWNAATGGEYILIVTTSGALLFGYFDGGFRVFTSSVGTGYSAGSRHWIRATRVQSTGIVTFYTGEDGTAWTQLGTTFAGTTVASTNTTLAVTIGSDSDIAGLFQGTIHRAIIKSGVAGTVRSDFNPDDVVKTATRTPATYTDAQSNLWTPQTAAWDWIA